MTELDACREANEKVDAAIGLIDDVRSWAEWYGAHALERDMVGALRELREAPFRVRAELARLESGAGLASKKVGREQG